MRHRRTGLITVTIVFLGYLGWNLVGGISAGGPERSPLPSASGHVAPVDPSPVATATVPLQSDSGHAPRVAYSVDVDEISGLAPTVAPGTTVELWVTWDRPLVTRPELEPVVRDAIVERIDAPLTPDGPSVATFLVTRKRLEHLMWADRYGSISAVALPG